MVKIGYSFSDFVSKGKGRARKNNHGVSQDYRRFFPEFLLLASFLLIFLKLIELQVIKRDYYKTFADENRLRTKIIPAERGIIFDRNNKALVRNVSSFYFLNNNKVVVLDKENALKLMARGQKLETGVQREYLFKDAFAHVLGYIGQITAEQLLLAKFSGYRPGDLVGKIGIEREYEQLLKGKDGRQLYEVNAKGEIVRFLGKDDPIPGKDIKITIDLDLQLAAFDAMSNVQKGTVLISDPRSGAILVMISKPSFDPNMFTHSQDYSSGSFSSEGNKLVYKNTAEILGDNINQPLLNRAIGGMYPPGSTFKLINAAAALDSNSINRDTRIEDTGVLRVGDYSYGNWYFTQYGRTEGYLNVIDALKRSNDIFFYKSAELTGVKKINEKAVQFGLGQKLGIDLAGEEKGLLPDPAWKQKQIGESWYLGDTYHLGIGQGYLLTTPLQVNFWTLVFANSGTLYKPYFLDGKSQILNKNFIDPQSIDLVRQGMKESCSDGGVAWPLFQFRIKNSELRIDNKDIFEVKEGTLSADLKEYREIKIACKTGTAETNKNENPHAWITLFAPYYNPEIVVTVLVENGGEGSNVAAPIAKKILESYFSRK